MRRNENFRLPPYLSPIHLFAGPIRPTTCSDSCFWCSPFSSLPVLRQPFCWPTSICVLRTTDGLCLPPFSTNLFHPSHCRWWRSFFTSGFTAIYLFLYCIHFFNTKLTISGAVSTILYFSYTAIFVFVFFLMTGRSFYNSPFQRRDEIPMRISLSLLHACSSFSPFSLL